MKNLTLEIKQIWRQYWAYRLYVFLLLAAFLKQLLHETQLVDGHEFFTAAQNLWYHGFPDSCNPQSSCDHWLHETRRTWGYPVLIFVAFFKSKLLYVIQFILALLVPVQANRLLNQLNINGVFKLWLYFFILFPLQYFYSALLMPEIWVQYLILIGTLYFYQKNFLKISLVLAALLLLKPVFIVFLPLLLIYMFFDFSRRKILLIPAFIFGLVSLVNMQKTGVFHYCSISVENSWEYNARAILNVTMTDAERLDFESKRFTQLQNLNFKEKYQLMQADANQIIGNHIMLYMWLHTKGCMLALADPGRYDLLAFTEIPQGIGFMDVKGEGGTWQKINSQPFWLLVYISIFLIINIVRLFFGIWAFIKSTKLFLPIFIVIAILIGVVGPVGSARYLFPLMPLICLLAAAGINYFKQKKHG